MVIFHSYVKLPEGNSCHRDTFFWASDAATVAGAQMELDDFWQTHLTAEAMVRAPIRWSPRIDLESIYRS